MDIILEVLATGIACGLYTYWEAYLNYIDWLPRIFSLEETPRRIQKLNEAFAEWLKTTASSPKDPIKDITPQGVYQHCVNMQDSYRRMMEDYIEKKAKIATKLT